MSEKVKMVENYLIEVERKIRRVKRPNSNRKNLKSATVSNIAICDVVETAADGA